MSSLYDRRAAVIVNDLRFEADRNVEGSRVRGFRILFRVNRSIDSKANTAEAQIANLSADSQGRIQIRRPQFSIEAGYRETSAVLFQGEAVEIQTVKQPTGFLTTIKAADGYSATRQRVNEALPPGATVAQAIEAVAKSIGVSADRALARARAGDFDGAIGRFLNGITLSGRTRDEMDKLAKSAGFQWSIQNGELLMQLPNEGSQESAVLLSPSTGLIGSPERVIDEKRKSAVIIRARSLLQPKIRPGRLIEVESSQISGVFKTEKVSHSGDSAGGEYQSEIEAIEL